MTCVWKGLLNCLEKSDFLKFGISKKPKELEFVKFLKSKNRICYKVRWQQQSLTKQFLDECYNAVNEFNESSIRRGYLCSTCDPFIILTCELFKVNILHVYCGNQILYETKGSSRLFKVKSNRGHFQKM